MKKILITGGSGFIGTNLINFFLKKKIKIVLITSNIKKGVFKNKLFKSKIIKVTPFALLSDRVNKALSASNTLKNELKKSEKKNTIILSLQGSSLAIIVSKFLGFKIVVRNAEDALSSTIYAENKDVDQFLYVLYHSESTFGSFVVNL